MKTSNSRQLESPDVSERRRYNSETSLSEAVQKIVQQCTQENGDEINVKDVVKKVVDDINTQDTSLTKEPFYFATSKQIPNHHSWQERETAIKEQPIRQHHSLDNGDRSQNKNSKKQNSSLLDNYEEEYSSSVELSPESSAEFSKENPTILVIGGMNPKNLHTIGVGGAVLNYNPEQEKWVKYSTVPAPRHNHSAAFYNECLYVVGGCNPLETLQQNRYIAKRSCYKLDTSTYKWSSLQDMKFKRYDHGLVVFDGQIYAVGGQDGEER
ncbi:uncharacterized protein CEXT_21901 [Caerostris extrusa]|uniref:Attractin/MKLN-like beta-propeller domain-containing protein n=1 Tax=Caerostris extrusa TaxID=172846 RepID=A0AAV4MII0_CAEEX|nr:uncharacterized protein CEXT_21901 [Caerostris extrusa]